MMNRIDPVSNRLKKLIEADRSLVMPQFLRLVLFKGKPTQAALLSISHFRKFTWAVENTAQQQQKAILLSENGLSDIWLPFVDSFRSQLHGSSKEIRNSCDDSGGFVSPPCAKNVRVSNPYRPVRAQSWLPQVKAHPVAFTFAGSNTSRSCRSI
jgi:hypothetical protein